MSLSAHGLNINRGRFKPCWAVHVVFCTGVNLNGTFKRRLIAKYTVAEDSSTLQDKLDEVCRQSIRTRRRNARKAFQHHWIRCDHLLQSGRKRRLCNNS